MKKILAGLWLSMAAGVLLTGCGNGANELSSSEKAAFKDAPPEIQQLWEGGLKADKANDYLTASTNLRALLGKEITPQQLSAVQAVLAGLNERIHEEAAKGSASAQKALDAMQADAPPRR